MNYLGFIWVYDLKKMRIKNSDLKIWDLIIRFLKLQLSVWQNCNLAFKIVRFKKIPYYLRLKNTNFMCFQIAIF